MDRDPECRLCTLRRKARTVCMPAELERSRVEGEERVLYTVAEKPGALEDRAGRPQVGTTGLLLRSQIRRHWHGPVVYDNAVRCAPGKEEVPTKGIDACRGYLSSTLAAVAPERVLALGSVAHFALLGRDPQVFSLRVGDEEETDRVGYGWLRDGRTPVFMLMNPAAAARNPFVKDWFRRDLAWALTVPVQELRLGTPWRSFARVVETEADARAAVEEARESELITYDAEWAGWLYSAEFEILKLSICGVEWEDPWVWPAAALRDPRLLAPLRELLADPRAPKVPQNGKADELALSWGLRMEVRGTVGDLRLWRRLDDPEARANLQTLQELVGMGGGKEENEGYLIRAMKRCRKAGLSEQELDAIAAEFRCRPSYVRGVRGASAKSGSSTLDACKQFLYAMVPEEVGLRYVAMDALSQARLADFYRGRMAAPENRQIARLWREVVQPAHEAFVAIERWGVAIDRVSLEALDARLTHRIEEAQRWFAPYEDRGLFTDKAGTPVPFGARNNAHVRRLLFDHLKLRPPKFTSTGLAATSAGDVLEPLAREHEAPRRILALRRATNERDTFVGQIRRYLAADGRIHTSFNIDGARTGRLSSHEPNLQNMPKDTLLRGLFVAVWDMLWATDPRFEKAARLFRVARRRAEKARAVFLEFDYSTLELRVLALLSGDPVMRGVFQRGLDLHLETARAIAPHYRVDPQTVTKADPLRAKAKVINFGLAYGKTDETLAEDLGISVPEAAKLRAVILGGYPQVARWLKAQVRKARRTGQVETWWAGEVARRRPLWRIADDDRKASSNAQNAAVNTPVQGTASDFCLASIGAIVRWIRENNIPAKLVLTVHDSILLECPVEWVPVVARKVRQIMQGWDSDGVPLVVDAKIGETWGSMVELRISDEDLSPEGVRYLGTHEGREVWVPALSWGA